MPTEYHTIRVCKSRQGLMAICGQESASVPAVDGHGRPLNPGVAALALADKLWTGRKPKVKRRTPWIYDVEMEATR